MPADLGLVSLSLAQALPRAQMLAAALVFLLQSCSIPALRDEKKCRSSSLQLFAQWTPRLAFPDVAHRRQVAPASRNPVWKTSATAELRTEPLFRQGTGPFQRLCSIGKPLPLSLSLSLTHSPLAKDKLHLKGTRLAKAMP